MSESIGYTTGDDGIVTLTIDVPGQPVNVIGAAVRADLSTVVNRLEAARDQLRGVIITSAKPAFVVGGDLDEIAALADSVRPAADAASIVDELKALLRRLELLGRPVVAALNGSALGAGWELALACHHRLCLDDPAIELGLPEVQFGLLPGAGGLVRTVRLLGMEQALPLLLEGRRLRPAAALKAGLLHGTAASVAELLAAARQWILGDPPASQPWDRPGNAVPAGTSAGADRFQTLAALPALLYQRTRGTLPAPEKILAAAVESTLVEFETAQVIETRYFAELAAGNVSRNLLTAFWTQHNAIRRGQSRPAGEPGRRTKKVGVLGAGMMGAGIAYACATSEVEVVLQDLSAEAVERGRQHSVQLLDRRVASGKLSAQQREAILGRITTTTSVADFAGCDLVIEAVFEDRQVKQRVLAAAESAAAPDAVIASNTSSLPISGLADAVPDAGRFLGLHFSSPVHRMPLVEIIRGARTAPATLAAAFDFVRQLGKTPIVVNDSRGFYLTRVFASYATEGIAMLAEGVPAALIENVAATAGMAVGPLAVCDEISLTLMQQISRQNQRDLLAEGRASTDHLMSGHPAFAVVDQMVDELNRPGRAGGAGFYDYPADGPKRLWPELAARFTRTTASVADVRDRLLFVQAIEAARCLDHGVLGSVADANLGSLFGFGFAPWTGGALQFINSYGVAEFAERASYLAHHYGNRFVVPRVIRDKAARGERFG